MAKTIEFTATNVKPFSAWLKRFSSIEHSLLIGIDEANKCFTAKSYNEEKSVVKFSKISFSDAGFVQKKGSDSSFIKAGIYNIPRVIKSLDHFQAGEFSFLIQFEEVLNDEGQKDLAATAFLLKSASLKMKIECTSLNIFKYIPDDLFHSKIAQANPITTFDLPNVTIEKINSLSDLDKEYKFLEFLTRDKKVFVRGKSFELDIADNGDEKAVISVYKDQFDKLDIESYEVDFGEEKLVYRSKDSDTITVTSMVVKDEKYEEESMEF